MACDKSGVSTPSLVAKMNKVGISMFALGSLPCSQRVKHIDGAWAIILEFFVVIEFSGPVPIHCGPISDRLAGEVLVHTSAVHAVPGIFSSVVIKLLSKELFGCYEERSGLFITPLH